jgi:hypothetical protein
MGLLKMVYQKTKHVKACANNKCNLITLGGVNEVVLIRKIVLMSHRICRSEDTQVCSQNVLGEPYIFPNTCVSPHYHVSRDTNSFRHQVECPLEMTVKINVFN